MPSLLPHESPDTNQPRLDKVARFVAHMVVYG